MQLSGFAVILSGIYKQYDYPMLGKSFHTIVITVALCVAVSCGHGGKTGMDSIGMDIDSIVADTAVALGGGNGTPTCRLSLRIQYLKGGRQACAINDTLLRNGILIPDYLSLTDKAISPRHAVDSFIGRFIADYRREYGAMYSGDHEHAATYCYDYSVRTATESNRKNILTYIATEHIRSGETQGTRQTVAINFNAVTGKRLTLGDIFVPGHTERLKEIITERLLDDYDADNIGELNGKTIFAGIDVYASENFIIGRKDITFIYCENEIACRDIGEIRVKVPMSDLKKIIKKDYE